jgi:RNA polymerase sigma-70 factor (ECF subfamily)
LTDAPAGAPEVDDRELIRRCQAGDIAAFEPLVEKYRQRVWRLAYQVLRDREEAWDCAQEAFVRAYSSLSSFRGQSAFYTWLFRITVNVATDRHRSRGARTRALGGDPIPEEEWERTAIDTERGPDEAAVQAEQRERIRAALESLPVKARTIIMLSDVEGLSYKEIAEVLNCPIGTVMSRLHNARKRLRSLLGPMLAVVLILMAALLAFGIGQGQAGEPIVRFGVRVLQASNTPGPALATAPRALAPAGQAPDPEVDPRMQRLLPHLRSLFRYSDYTTIDRHRAEVTLGTHQRFMLPGTRQLEVVPEQLQGQSVRMTVRLFKGEHPELRTSIVAAPGAPAVFGGPTHGDGVLIIILWANPNPPPR